MYGTNGLIINLGDTSFNRIIANTSNHYVAFNESNNIATAGLWSAGDTTHGTSIDIDNKTLNLEIQATVGLISN
jgi:hypothetical protein